MQQMLTNLAVQPIGHGEHCKFKVCVILEESERIKAHFNKNDTKTIFAYKLRALAEKLEANT